MFANPQAPRQSANCSLLFSTPSTPNGQSVYQDTATVGSTYLDYTFGVALKAPDVTGATVHPAYVVVHEIASNGALLTSHQVNVSVGKSYRFFSGEFTKPPNTHHFRFEIYLGAAHVNYEMTDAWVAPKP